MCGDFRRLNAITRLDRYPLPNLNSFNEEMAGCVIFSKIDLKSAYHQVEVELDDQEKTTINTTLGLFKFLRMPFGLKNAGQCFQRNVNIVLDGIPRIFVYMDDVIIASRNEKEHIEDLQRVLQRLQQFNLLINKDKCVLAKERIEFLGHEICQFGVRIPNRRIDAIKFFPRPRSKKELERFLGLISFVHKFVRNASGLTAPLHELRKCRTSKEFMDAWKSTHEAAFQKIKDSICRTTLLSHPMHDVPTEIWTDASDYASGAVLMQKQCGTWTPLAFWSKAFNQAQRRYSPFDKELLALSNAVLHFREFIEGNPIVVRTDHKPLVTALRKRNDKFSGLQTRHFNKISQYVDRVEYKEGSTNVIADALSRMPNLEEGVQDDTNNDELFICSNDRLAVPTSKKLRGDQINDAGLQKWIRKHLHDDDPKYRPIQIELDGVKIWVVKNGDRAKILVPTVQQKDIFNAIHELTHAGSKSTIRMINDNYYWPNFKKDVSKWCKECEKCQRQKIARHTKSAIGQIPQPKGRFSHLHIDLVGPFKQNCNKNMLFTIIDRWTGWCDAIPVSNLNGQTANAQTLAKHLINHWVARFGVPRIITSDRGSQFTSQVWTEVMKLLGIKQDLTTSYNPQHNGKVERLHRTLKNALRSRLDGRNDWLNHLPWVLLGMRNLPNVDTGLSPAVLVYGQNLEIPGLLVTTREEIGETLFAEQIASSMKEQKFIEPYWHGGEKRKTFVSKDLFKVSHVLIRNDNTRNTWDAKYVGPFKVMERHDKYFLVQLPTKTDRIGIDRLKPFYMVSQ